MMVVDVDSKVRLKVASNAKKGVLKRAEKVRLMAETGCDLRTIRKWERGEPIKDASRTRLEKAARKLNIPTPLSSTSSGPV